jgi:predicted nucleic acid-binding protein
MPVRIYLDTSVYNRPFDDQSQTRIRLETEGFLAILEKAMSGTVYVVGSSVLFYENSKNPLADRRERINGYFQIILNPVNLNNGIVEKAQIFAGKGFDPIDSLHLACAEFGKSEYFITCDDNILKKRKRLEGVAKMELCSPIEFIVREVFEDA